MTGKGNVLQDSHRVYGAVLTFVFDAAVIRILSSGGSLM